MPKPTKQDAELLLRIEELRRNKQIEDAFNWLWREFAKKQIKTYEDYQRLYPEGSEGREHVERISAFWETVGAITKHGLINEDLLFDRYLVKPYWEQLKVLVEHDRKEENSLIAENFEWLARRSVE